MKVDEIMSRPVVTVPPDMPLKEVAALLAERGISGVPVVAADTLVGVVSESDIVLQERGPDERPRLLARLRRQKGRDLGGATTAGDVMSSPPVTIEPWTSIAWAAWLTTEHDGNRLPVVEHDRLVGIVARADLVRAFARSDEEIEREIRDEVLAALDLSPSDISVTVERGEVSLEGDLQSDEDVDALPRAVQRVAGVVRVHSGLSTRMTDEVGTKT